MFRMPPIDRETTAARAAKDFDLLSTVNGYPEDFSVFEGEPLFIRCARKPVSTLPLPRPLVRAIWRYRFGEAIRESVLKRAARSHARNGEKPGGSVKRIALRDAITGETALEHKLSSPAPLFSEMPAGYRDRGADYTSRIALDTAGLLAGVYECVVREDRGRASQDIYVNIKPRMLDGVDLLCVLPSFTWQAYNRIGGGSFYSAELGHQRTICSQRPMHHHSDNSIQPALALLSTFREHGLKVACVDSWDLHRGLCPAGKVPVAAILVHDEYCSAAMRAQIERLLDDGTALLVLSGNTCWWHIDVDGPNISVNKAPARTTLWHRAAVPEENTFVSSYRFGDMRSSGRGRRPASRRAFGISPKNRCSGRARLPRSILIIPSSRASRSGRTGPLGRTFRWSIASSTPCRWTAKAISIGASTRHRWNRT